MKTLFGATLVLTVGAAASGQSVLFVDAAAPPKGDGLTWATAFDDLQDALASARVPGSGAESIWVAAGTYVPHGTDDSVAFELVDGVAMLGGFAGGETSVDERNPAENDTVLSGDLDGNDEPGWGNRIDNATTVVRAVDCGLATALDGFTVYGGHDATNWGAGMRAEGGAPAIRRCRFTENLSGGGGGMFIWNSNATIEGTRFDGNYCHLGTGGGIRTAGTSAPVIVGCVFEHNTSVGGNTITPEGAGGGVDHRADFTWMTVRGCTFRSNTARPFWPAGGSLYARGGGLHSFLAYVDVRDCVFEDNWANAGGGLYAWHAAIVANCRFDANTVDALEGDIVDYGGYGAAAFFRGSGEASSLTNCTVVRNEGEAGAITSGGSVDSRVDNCILWANTATGEEVSTREAQLDGDAVVRHSCVQGLLEPIPGEDPPNPDDFPGSFDDAPGFVDLANGDTHLEQGSPCIDAGDNAALPGDILTDLDGAARYVDDPETPDTGVGASPIIDMGAYERQVESATPGDVDGDGAVDFNDLLTVLAGWGPCPLPPTGCPADFDGDGSIGFTDLLVVLSGWTG